MFILEINKIQMSLKEKYIWNTFLSNSRVILICKEIFSFDFPACWTIWRFLDVHHGHNLLSTADIIVILNNTWILCVWFRRVFNVLQHSVNICTFPESWTRHCDHDSVYTITYKRPTWTQTVNVIIRSRVKKIDNPLFMPSMFQMKLSPFMLS